MFQMIGNKKNCPFKKRVRMIPAQRIYQDMFAWCDGERCMAFKDGKCLRLEKVEPITYRGLENPWGKV
mgnify:CR=1 FL=1